MFVAELRGSLAAHLYGSPPGTPMGLPILDPRMVDVDDVAPLDTAEDDEALALRAYVRAVFAWLVLHGAAPFGELCAAVQQLDPAPGHEGLTAFAIGVLWG